MRNQRCLTHRKQTTPYVLLSKGGALYRKEVLRPSTRGGSTCGRVYSRSVCLHPVPSRTPINNGRTAALAKPQRRQRQPLNAEAVGDISPCRLAGSRDLAHLAFLLGRYDAGAHEEMGDDKQSQKNNR